MEKEIRIHIYRLIKIQSIKQIRILTSRNHFISKNQGPSQPMRYNKEIKRKILKQSKETINLKTILKKKQFPISRRSLKPKKRA